MSVLFASVLFGAAAHAVPAQFTHQGRLLDADGLPLEGDTTITFRITAAESGGDSLWEEALSVELSSGFYSVILGTDEDANPLDSEVFSQAPVWLELQLDGEPAMFPRSAIQAVPYANMAQVAEEVDGGPVNASDISVGGTPVINDDGEWIGPTPSIDWSDIEGIPADFADGVDDDTDTDTDTDSFADLSLSCVDGDIPVWDAIVGEWNCDMDQDTLAGIGCSNGQLIQWNESALGWICADDTDTVLSEDEVDAYVANNGFAMTTDVFGGSFTDLADIPDGLSDGDDNTQLSEDEVDAYVANNGFAMTTDVFGGSFTDLADVPEGLSDGDDNTQLSEDDVDAYVANNGFAMSTDVFGGSFTDLADVPEGLSDGDDNTQLSEGDVDAYVANNGFAMSTDVFGGSFSDLSDVPDGLSDGDDDTYRTDEEIREVASAGGFDLDPGTTIGGSAIATADEAGVPSGVIVMWSGTTPPDGWALCNGSSGTPDLRGRFIVASGDGYGTGDNGSGSSGVGASTVTVIKGSAHGAEWRTTALSSISGSTPVPRYYALAFIMKT